MFPEVNSCLGSLNVGVSGFFSSIGVLTRFFLNYIQPTHILWHNPSKTLALGILKTGQPTGQGNSISAPWNCFMPEVCKDGDC